MTPYITAAVLFFITALVFLFLFLHRYFVLTNFFANSVVAVGTVVKSRSTTQPRGLAQIASVKVRTQNGSLKKVTSEPFLSYHGIQVPPGTRVKVQVGKMREWGSVRNTLYITDKKYVERQKPDVQWTYLAIGTAFLLFTIVMVLSALVAR